jgi:hypothetical protein
MAGFQAKKKMALSRMGDEVQTYDPFMDRATFNYAYSIRPRRCYNTQKLIWGQAVRGRRLIYGPAGEPPIVEDRWYHKDEGIIMILKGLTNV